MTIFAIVIGLIGLGTAAVIYIRYSKQVKELSERRTELEGRLNHLEGRRKKAERRIEEVTERAKGLERDLAEAVARRDERAVAHALWNLELERSERQWRDVVVPAQRLDDNAADNAGRRLAFAVQQEVDRLREEVGVSIRFEGGLDCDLGPEAALASLRISEELLATASKHADEVTVIVDQGNEPSVSLQFICSGWDGTEDLETNELGNNLKAMARRLDGWVRFEMPSDEDLHVSVRLPVGEPLETEDESANEVPVTAAALSAMKIASAAFGDRTRIPDRYAKGTENLSPPLQWEDPPAGTVELALTCHDPDAPNGAFVHWLVAGIDPTSVGADEGKPPTGAIEGVNGYGDEGYGGPQPPAGDAPHRYVFQVHACSETLDLSPGFNHSDLQAALAKCEIASGKLIGMFSRP